MVSSWQSGYGLSGDKVQLSFKEFNLASILAAKV